MLIYLAVFIYSPALYPPSFEGQSSSKICMLNIIMGAKKGNSKNFIVIVIYFLMQTL